MENEKGKEAKDVKNNPKDGLPESANDGKKKNPIVLFVIGGMIIFGVLYGVYNYIIKKNSNNIPQIQENYAPDVQVQDGKGNGFKNVPTGSPGSQKLTTNQSKNYQAMMKERMAYIQEKQQELAKRISAPMLVVNSRSEQKSSGTTPSVGAATNDPNSQFMNQVSQEVPDTVDASNIAPLNYLITEGTMIHAALETAVNSDLPGYLRAIVSNPVYSADGSQILIPSGSRLIGKYKSGMIQGQSRIFVVWTRLIIPSGISVNLGSPGVDNLGVAGMGADAIDHHFFQQFGTAILLSVLGAGTANLGVSSNDQYNAAQAYRESIADSFTQTANQSLKATGVIAPTIHIDQGKAIMVFVAHDLNFKKAMMKAGQKINVF